MSRLVVEYEPDVLVLKKLHPSRRSVDLELLSLCIHKLAIDNGLEINQHSISEMETFFEPNGRINKKQLAELVCHRYPALRHELHREQNSLNLYHIRMFEAVALATVARDEMCEQPAPSESELSAKHSVLPYL